MRRGFSPTDLRAVTKIHLISSSLMKWENKLSQIRWRRHRLCPSCEAVSCGPASFPVHVKTTTTVVFTSTQSNDPKQLVARLIGRLLSLCVSVQSWRLSSLSSRSFTEDTLRPELRRHFNMSRRSFWDPAQLNLTDTVRLSGHMTLVINSLSSLRFSSSRSERAHERGGVYWVWPITDMDSLTDSRASYFTTRIKLFIIKIRGEQTHDPEQKKLSHSCWMQEEQLVKHLGSCQCVSYSAPWWHLVKIHYVWMRKITRGHEIWIFCLLTRRVEEKKILHETRLNPRMWPR